MDAPCGWSHLLSSSVRARRTTACRAFGARSFPSPVSPWSRNPIAAVGVVVVFLRRLLRVFIVVVVVVVVVFIGRVLRVVGLRSSSSPRPTCRPTARVGLGRVMQRD